MRKKIKKMVTTYTHISIPAKDARKVRGFFADLDTTDSNLHNHSLEGKDIYRYPVIQYKVLHGHPVIVALESGISSIYPHLMKETELKIGDEMYTDMEMDISLSQPFLGDSKQVQKYRFLTPWIALNQKNYVEYGKSDDEKKQEMLANILIGNILSFCKRFDVTIEQKLQVTHHLQEVPVVYKGTKMQAFLGSFEINASIPDLCGLGKGTARGFGTVVSEKEKKGEGNGE